MRAGEARSTRCGMTPHQPWTGTFKHVGEYQLSYKVVHAFADRRSPCYDGCARCCAALDMDCGSGTLLLLLVGVSTGIVSVHEAYSLIHDSSKALRLSVLTAGNGRKLRHLLTKPFRLVHGWTKIPVLQGQLSNSVYKNGSNASAYSTCPLSKYPDRSIATASSS